MAIQPIIQNNSNITKLMRYCNAHKHDECKILSKEEEQALVAKWKDVNPEKLRQMLVMHNIALVFNIATKFMMSVNSFDDLVQNGFVGLVTAANKFDFNRQNKFSTYAYSWIYKHIWATSYLETNNPDPMTNAISLDTSITDPSGKKTSFEDNNDTISNYLENHLDNFFADEAVVSTSVQVEKNAMSSLYESMQQYMLSNDFTDVDRAVFNGTFVNNRTIRQISADNNISTQEVKKSYEKILKQMKEKLKEQGISSFEEIF